ncbi:uncharacterized protein [Paramisgurnus dabryanus]|uniref:uncharacterized protein n=1 Tax=Paramisgurnus dabryanus TaxID=90735 RepID=UPI003CCFC1E6
MFLLVEFVETKTLNIISESWFEDGVTWWPNYKSDDRINRAIQKKEEPGGDWKKYDVRVLLRAGDYLKAREKLKASLNCNTSELQTDGEEEVIRKRKIKPRKIFGDTDSDSEPEEGTKRKYHNLTNCPAPSIPAPTPDTPSTDTCQDSFRPRLDLRQTESSSFTDFTAAPPVPFNASGIHLSPLHHCSVGQTDVPDLTHAKNGYYTVPPVAAPTGPSSSVGHISNDRSFRPRFIPVRTGTETIPCSAAPPVPFNTSGIPLSPLRHCSFGQTDVPDLTHAEDGYYTVPPVATSTGPSNSVGHMSAMSNDRSFRPTFRLGRTGSETIPCSAAQLHILTLLENVKEQQMQLAAAVNTLAKRIGTETPVAEMPHNISVPLATMPEVEELEEWLKDARNARAKQNMISALGAVGGQNTKQITWNILHRLFSDSVAKKINWKGVNGKKCFKEMLTRNLLIRAVRSNQSSTGAADTEIDSYSIRWFNLASDRGGGRKERARAKEAINEMSDGN